MYQFLIYFFSIVLMLSPFANATNNSSSLIPGPSQDGKYCHTNHGGNNPPHHHGGGGSGHGGHGNGSGLGNGNHPGPTTPTPATPTPATPTPATPTPATPTPATPTPATPTPATPTPATPTPATPTPATPTPATPTPATPTPATPTPATPTPATPTPATPTPATPTPATPTQNSPTPATPTPATPTEPNTPAEEPPAAEQPAPPATPQEQEKRELKAKLRPAFYLDFDRAFQIVNLTPYDEVKARGGLVRGENNKGYQTIYYSLIEGGIGPSVLFNYQNAAGIEKALWAQIGLIPIKGKEALFVRHADSLKEAQAMPKRRSLPEPKEILEAWRTGDAMTYSSKGGVIFSAALGAGMASISSSQVEVGDFQIYLEKASDQQVAVRIQDLKVTRGTYAASLTLASVGQTNYDEMTSGFPGFSYLINIQDPDGAKVLKLFLDGYVLAAQEAADKGVVAQKIDTLYRNQNGKVNYFFLGLPIIANVVVSSGQAYEFSQTNTMASGLRSDVHYGVYQRANRGRLFNTHVSKTESFYGSAYELSAKDGTGVSKGYFGQYTYVAEDDSTSSTDLENSQLELIKRTGLRNEMKVNVPAGEDVGYGRTALTVTLDEEHTNRLIGELNANSVKVLTKQIRMQAENYFSTNQDILNLCGDSISHIAFEQCSKTHISTSVMALKDMSNALDKMRQARQRQDDKDFVKAYAEFGKALLENAFTFQLGLSLAGPGVELDYVIETTELAYYRVVLTSTKLAGKFNRVQMPRSSSGRLAVTVNNIPAKGVAVYPRPVNPTVSP